MPFRDNVMPAADSVFAPDVPSARWNGTDWEPRGILAPGTAVVGKAGGPMAGAYFDWNRKQWFIPDGAGSAMQPWNGGGGMQQWNGGGGMAPGYNPMAAILGANPLHLLYALATLAEKGIDAWFAFAPLPPLPNMRDTASPSTLVPNASELLGQYERALAERDQKMRQWKSGVDIARGAIGFAANGMTGPQR